MDALTLLPPLLAIVVAIRWRNVYAALGLALLASEILIVHGNPATGLLHAVDQAAAVFKSPDNTRVLLFCLLIGSLIVLMRESGGVAAFAQALIRNGVSRTRRRAEMTVAITGMVIFIETNISILSAGILGRPLYDRHGLSRARLAYIIDSTSAPVSVLILLNAWGAYALALVGPFGFANPVAIVAGSVVFNAYALLTLAGIVLTIITGKAIGPMRAADAATVPAVDESGPAPTRPVYMWLPVAIMIGGALFFMWWTGKGNLIHGHGPQSILWALSLAVAVCAALLAFNRVFPPQKIQELIFQGIGEMVPIVTVLLISIALGASLRELGTGTYIASLAKAGLPAFAAPAILFLLAAFISFTTGTSWGTYGIMVPIAMPVAIGMGLPPALALGAVLGGGVFGDHCSPISDTTVIASAAAGVNHMRHVSTQMPYAFVAALLSIGFYLVAGLLF